MSAGEAEVNVEYSEQSFDIGDISTSEDAGSPATFVIPGKFGTAMSLLASVSVGSFTGHRPDVWFWWWIATSIDGEYWHALAPPGDSAFRIMQADGTGGERLHGPFASRLAVRFATKYSARRDDGVLVNGLWHNVRLGLAVQRF